MKDEYLRRNVGYIDQIVRLVMGAALIVIPVLYKWPSWTVAILAAVGGSTILEGIIAY
ncbi:YgaP family membrane protein [Candidatus Formimonas warabiya]|uniref:YgaP family membrane protein n=1 Tax=Formimonas warabiya TaxID=1761012 RepID=UPI0011D07BBD|nr:DUF2892 domain-containing protein [Candidatus Formimonas warabiya]